MNSKSRLSRLLVIVVAVAAWLASSMVPAVSRAAEPAPAGGANVTAVVPGSDPIPLSGATVTAYDAVTGKAAKSVKTGAGGSYRLSGLAAGGYKLRATALGYLTAYYDGVASLAGASTVAVGEDGTAAVDFRLLPESSVTGLVTAAADDSVPLSGATVTAYDAVTGKAAKSVKTGADGSYRLAGLAAGDYKLRATAPGHLTSYYGGATLAAASPATVAIGETIDGFDFALTAEAVLAGNIRRPGTEPSPVPAATVTAYVAVTGKAIKSVKTGADGSYRLSGLAAGDYKLRAIATGYLTTYYDGAGSLAAATPVAAVPGQTTMTDVTITPEAGITGSVTGPLGALTGASVTAFNAVSGKAVKSTKTDTDGAYHLGGLPAGQYKVRFTETDTNYGLVTVYNGGAATLAAAPPFDVAADSVTLDVDADLQLPAPVTKTVTPTKANTVTTGVYSLKIPAGTVTTATTATVTPLDPADNGGLPGVAAHIDGAWSGPVTVTVPWDRADTESQPLVLHDAADGLRVSSGTGVAVSTVSGKVVASVQQTALSEVTSANCPLAAGMSPWLLSTACGENLSDQLLQPVLEQMALSQGEWLAQQTSTLPRTSDCPRNKPTLLSEGELSFGVFCDDAKDDTTKKGTWTFENVNHATVAGGLWEGGAVYAFTAVDQDNTPAEVTTSIPDNVPVVMRPIVNRFTNGALFPGQKSTVHLAEDAPAVKITTTADPVSTGLWAGLGVIAGAIPSDLIAAGFEFTLCGTSDDAQTTLNCMKTTLQQGLEELSDCELGKSGGRGSLIDCGKVTKTGKPGGRWTAAARILKYADLGAVAGAVTDALVAGVIDRGDHKTLRVRNLSNPQVLTDLFKIELQPVTDGENLEGWTPDGRAITTGSPAGTQQIDIETGSRGGWITKFGNPVKDVANPYYSPSGVVAFRAPASAGVLRVCAPGAVGCVETGTDKSPTFASWETYLRFPGDRFDRINVTADGTPIQGGAAVVDDQGLRAAFNCPNPTVGGSGSGVCVKLLNGPSDAVWGTGAGGNTLLSPSGWDSGPVRYLPGATLTNFGGPPTTGRKLTPDGRYLLAAAGTGTNTGLYLYDLQDPNAAPRRIDVTAGGTAGNSYVTGSSFLNPAGTHALYSSYASNLVGGDTNGQLDVFLTDLTTGATMRVNTASDGSQANEGNASTLATFSPDGSRIAFNSPAKLTADDNTDGTQDGFVKDLDTGRTIRFLNKPDGTKPALTYPFEMLWSPDGKRVGFTYADAAKLGFADHNGGNRSNVFIAKVPPAAEVP